MNPKAQMVICLVLGVALLVEGSSLLTAPGSASPAAGFGRILGVAVVIGAPCCFYLAWKGYQKSRSSDDD
ncbi:MAG TPA: hypothetical protein VMB25_09190 [Bryobacteraceae bacterium]|nr:hypothetical protein [Bryobacteraceae bacterium]